MLHVFTQGQEKEMLLDKWVWSGGCSGGCSVEGVTTREMRELSLFKVVW